MARDKARTLGVPMPNTKPIREKDFEGCVPGLRREVRRLKKRERVLMRHLGQMLSWTTEYQKKMPSYCHALAALEAKE